MSASRARFLLAGSLIGLLSACQEAAAPEVATDVAPQFGPGNKDRSGLSAPRNLRITGNTTFSVSLAWDASNGAYGYRIISSHGYMQGSNGPSYTWPHLEAGRTYSFYVYAIDPYGGRSTNSNTVTIMLPADVQAPTAPALTLLNVGPNHASLSWLSTDDGPFIFYDVFRDGVAVASGTSVTSATFNGLQPATAYTFTARARDNGINWSPVSTLTVRTPAADEADTTPPSAPTNVAAYSLDGDREVQVYWSPASDNRTPHSTMLYEM